MEAEKVLFAIVLFRQALKNSPAYKSLTSILPQPAGKRSIFVYDNSPTPSHELPDGITYVHDPSNPGVSRAYNQAFLFARKNGFRFLLLLDQDSVLEKHTWMSYREAVAANPTVHVFAPTARSRRKIYSPFRLINGRGMPVSALKPGIQSLKKFRIINSGMLISVEAFETAGGYDERFPLDFSDIAFCERLHNHQFNFYLLDAFMIHHHSSSNARQSRARFEIYLKALLLYKLISNQRFSYWVAGFPRAVKLSAQSRDPWYLKQFFTSHS